jgi:putative transport protein
MALPGATLAGLYSGALTNAPALAAAQEVLRDYHRSLPAAALQQLTDQPVIAFGIAYPIGVLGVMLSFQIYRTVFRIKPSHVDPGNSIQVRDFRVHNPRVTGEPLAEVLRLHRDLGFIVSRIRHGSETVLATAESRLAARRHRGSGGRRRIARAGAPHFRRPGGGAHRAGSKRARLPARVCVEPRVCGKAD